MFSIFAKYHFKGIIIKQKEHTNGMFKLLDNVVKTIINHSFGNGLYQPFMVMTGGWFMALF